MAWNGSNIKDGSSVVSEKTHSVRTHFKYAAILISLVCIAVGVVLLSILRKNSSPYSPQVDGTARSAAIAEANHTIVTNTAPSAQKRYADMKPDEKLAYFRNKYGNNPPDNLKPVIHYLENPPKRKFSMKSSKYGIFKHPSERVIAGYISVEPGRFVMRPQTFDANFDKDFAESMFEKIEISDTDTEEQRLLKQAVIDTKRELAERVKGGETPSQIMTEYSRQLYELGQYRTTLQQEIFKACQNPEKTDADVADAIQAANLMLEKKGLRPIQMPNMVVRQTNLSRLAKRINKQN